MGEFISNELEAEQAYVDKAYGCLEAAKERVFDLTSMVEVGKGGTNQARMYKFLHPVRRHHKPHGHYIRRQVHLILDMHRIIYPNNLFDSHKRLDKEGYFPYSLFQIL